MASFLRALGIVLAAGFLLAVGFGGVSAASGASETEGAAGSLGLIENYYREGEGFRAETEVLRFLSEHPRHPRRDELELLRAKLYYREGRFQESSLMLFSQLDRFRRGRAMPEARRLLTFSLVREERLEDAERLLRAGGGEAAAAGLESLRGVPEGAVSPETAVAWSTWLPGSGFFLLDQPGKAFAGIGVNLFLLGAAVLSFESGLPGAGLVFLLAEIAIYRGGMEAVRDSAGEQIARLRRERTGNWLRERGEPELLSVGLRFPFGGQ